MSQPQSSETRGVTDTSDVGSANSTQRLLGNTSGPDVALVKESSLGSTGSRRERFGVDVTKPTDAPMPIALRQAASPFRECIDFMARLTELAESLTPVRGSGTAHTGARLGCTALGSLHPHVSLTRSLHGTASPQYGPQKRNLELRAGLASINDQFLPSRTLYIPVGNVHNRYVIRSRPRRGRGGPRAALVG